MDRWLSPLKGTGREQRGLLSGSAPMAGRFLLHAGGSGAGDFLPGGSGADDFLCLWQQHVLQPSKGDETCQGPTSEHGAGFARLASRPCRWQRALGCSAPIQAGCSCCCCCSYCSPWARAGSRAPVPCCEMWGVRNGQGLCSFFSSWLHPGTASSSQGTWLLALGTRVRCFSSQSSDYGKGLGQSPFFHYFHQCDYF